MGSGHFDKENGVISIFGNLKQWKLKNRTFFQVSISILGALQSVV